MKLSESKQFELRREAFNLFYRAQFDGSNGNVSDIAFGLVTRVDAPRVLQLALKFVL